MAANEAQILANYYSLAKPRSVRLPQIKNASSGNTYDFNLPQAGVPRYVKLTFSGVVSRTEGATVGSVSASPWAPFNFFSDITLRDYAGTNRVNNITGWNLFRRSMQVAPKRFAYALNAPTGSLNNPPSYVAEAFAFSIPSGTASSTTTSNITFSVAVPCSLHHRTILGSWPAEVAGSESVVTVSLAGSQLAPTSAPATGASGLSPDGLVNFTYVSGATTQISVSGTLSATYYFYDVPQGTPLPLSMFSNAYELVRVRGGAKYISAGTNATFELLTGRTYYRMYEDVVISGVPTTVQGGAFAITGVQFLVNNSTPTLDEGIVDFLTRAAELSGTPLPDGALTWDWIDTPWVADAYGALSTNVILSPSITVETPSWLDVVRECLFPVSATSNLAQIGGTAG